MQASEPQANSPQDEGPELSLTDLVVALGEEKALIASTPGVTFFRRYRDAFG